MPSPLVFSPISVVPDSGSPSTDALLGGKKWGGAQGAAASISFSFPDAGSTWAKHYIGYAPSAEIANGFAALDEAQKSAVRAALQAWSEVANIKFVEVGETSSQVGDLRFAFSAQVDDGGAEAYTYKLLNFPAAGDVWISPSYRQTPVSFDFPHLLQHEIGHALGLKHPFDSYGSRMVLPGSQDYLGNTVMSYRSTPNAPNADASLLPATPMAYDVAAIQYLYGANRDFHAGDDTYVFLPDQNYYECLWDAGGLDVFDYSAASLDSIIDLQPGHWSQFGNPIAYSSTVVPASRDTVSIAFKTIIENAIGGSGNDTLIGNKANNVLAGGSGNDILRGGKGGDRLDGGVGGDTMAGGPGNDSYVVDSSNDIVNEFARSGTDKISTALGSYVLPDNVEVLEYIGAGNFSGTGNRRANTMVGGGGNDVLDGQGGNDNLVGGIGNDTYFIDKAGDRVVESVDGGVDAVNTMLGAYRLPGNVENLAFADPATRSFNGTGNDLDNYIVGGNGNDVLRGQGGNDTLQGNDGADILWGGDGDDLLLFDAADLAANGQRISGGNGTDTMEVAGGGVTLDLSLLPRGRAAGIEILDLSAAGGNRLLVNEASLADITGPAGHALTIAGSQGDSVTIAAAYWMDGGLISDAAGSFHFYSHGLDQLRVQADLDQFLL